MDKRSELGYLLLKQNNKKLTELNNNCPSLPKNA